MKNKAFKSILISLVAIAMVFAGCEELVVNKYGDYTAVYFYNGRSNILGNAQYDSISHSFFYSSGSTGVDTVWVDVRLTGIASPFSRPIPLKQIFPDGEQEDSKGQPGVHYIAFDNPQLASFLIMPENKVVAKIPIVLLRHESLQQKEYRLWLELGSNEYFDPGVKESQRFLIKISDLVVQPANWTRVWQSAFGTWSVVKMKFIIDYVGVTDFDIDILYVDMKNYLNQKAKSKLIEYEAANGPLYDETNKRVEFPIIY